MIEITKIILNLSFTIFAIYGIYVLVKWKKAAEKISKMCDEIHEEMNVDNGYSFNNDTDDI